MSPSKNSAIKDLPRVSQQTDSHCGPAVLQILYSNLRKHFTQDEIVAAARIGKIIKSRGSRPKQLASAVKKLTPSLQFWFKQEASIEDLEELINTYEVPVAVNWQGLFYEKLEEETPRDKQDRGHYSVVVGINLKKDQIVIQDPYSTFSDKNRTFSLSWFVTRWKDTVKDKNKKTEKIETLRTKHFLFILATKKAPFVKKLGLLPPTKLDVLKVKAKTK